MMMKCCRRRRRNYHVCYFPIQWYNKFIHIVTKCISAHVFRSKLLGLLSKWSTHAEHTQDMSTFTIATVKVHRFYRTNVYVTVFAKFKQKIEAIFVLLSFFFRMCRKKNLCFVAIVYTDDSSIMNMPHARSNKFLARVYTWQLRLWNKETHF